MQFKTLLVTAFSAIAMAQDLSSLNGDIASLTSAIGANPAALTSQLSVYSVLATALPSSLLTAITDPAVQSSLASDFDKGNIPSWYSALPPDVKSYLSAANTLSSAAASLTARVSSDVSSLSSELSSLSSAASSAASKATASGSSASSSGSSATSTGGAPAPTGAFIASMAGVVGVLALAVGL